jgi:HlyD family secretion protein
MTHPRHGTGSIRVSGNIECIEVAVASKLAGRVEKRLVDEGEAVTRGQVVARLEAADLQADRDLRLAEVKAAEAGFAELKAGSRQEEIEAARGALEKANALLAELLAGSRPQEVKAAEALRDAAKADYDRAAADFTRMKELFDRSVVTRQQYDDVRAAHDVAEKKYVQADRQFNLVCEGPRKEQIDQARAAKEQAAAQYNLVKKGPREETIAQAAAKVEQARAALRLAETRLGYATIHSPLTGVVLSKNVEEGEYVSPGTPIVTVADLENVWLRAYIDERLVGTKEVRLGREVEVTTDAYPGKPYPGRISFISSEAEFTPKQVQTEKERTRLVYRIKIDIKNPDKELKPGMPADAVVPAEREVDSGQ